MLFFKKIAILLAILILPAALIPIFIAMPMLTHPLPLYLSAAISALLVGVILGLWGVIPALFFQDIAQRYNKSIFSVILLYYLLGDYIPHQGVRTFLSLVWLLLIGINFFRLSSLKLSYKYWLFFSMLGAVSLYPITKSFIWHDMHYEYFQMDSIHYYVPQPWTAQLKNIHPSLPKHVQETQALIIGLTQQDIEEFEQMANEEGFFDSWHGAALPNPFQETIILNLGYISRELYPTGSKEQIDLAAVITHEMTHVHQFRYGLLWLMSQPIWKVEGHAIYAAQNYGLSKQYDLLNMIDENHLPKIEYSRHQMNLIEQSERGYHYYQYALYDMQAWYYLGYLNVDLDTFFSEDIVPADWLEIKSAWMNTHREWIAENK